MAEKLHERAGYHKAMLVFAGISAICALVGLPAVIYCAVVAHSSSPTLKVADGGVPMSKVGVAYEITLMCCAVVLLAALVVSVLWIVRNWRPKRPEKDDNEAFRNAIKEWHGRSDTGEILKAGAWVLDSFTPLQRDALQLSIELLIFLKRIGPAPAPKYSRDEIFGMSTNESRRLIEVQDGDFSEASAFHNGDNRIFPITGETLYRGIAHRHKRLVPWYEKLRASYALEFKAKVVEIHNRFAVEGFSDTGLLMEVECFDGLKNLRSIAELLWVLAYKLEEKKTTVAT